MGIIKMIPLLFRTSAALKIADFYSEERSITEPIVTVSALTQKSGGNGICKDSDTVTAMYKGSLASDGKVFDQSTEPFKFILGQGQVIPCWDKAFSQMQVGTKASINCPAASAYGEQGAGDAIPPNSDLKFDVELLNCENTN